jgi:hypothetical protein
MLYLGIDQHARQITVSLRDENGDVLLARRVSTQPEKIQAFFQRFTRQRLHDGEGFVVVLEVCGFNDWLIRMLHDYRCHKVILIQPYDRKKRKTDRRDAAALSELLWVNRERLLHGKPVRGLRQVDIASTTDQAQRFLLPVLFSSSAHLFPPLAKPAKLPEQDRGVRAPGCQQLAVR